MMNCNCLCFRINKNVAKEMIHSFLNDELAGKVYSSNEKENEELSRHLASKLKMLLRSKPSHSE